MAAVETSLAAHLAQLQGVIASLTTTKAAVAAETAGLGRAARRLRAMLAHLERQLALNGTRSKVCVCVGERSGSGVSIIRKGGLSISGHIKLQLQSSCPSLAPPSFT